MRSELEAELTGLQLQHEDECEKMQDELDLQKMIIIAGGEAEGITANAVESFGNKPQEDQEVNSKKGGEVRQRGGVHGNGGGCAR
ncbi:hypothetical protein COP1_046286 [Malus domestica]